MPAQSTSILRRAYLPNSSLRCRVQAPHWQRHDPERIMLQIYWRQQLSVYILVVDDEPDVEALFRQQFRRDIKTGRFTMEFAPSAPVALVRAAEIRDPSLILILSDINMPGMSGLEMMTKVRAGPPGCPRYHNPGLWRRRGPPQGAGARRGRPADKTHRFFAVAPGDRYEAWASCMTATILVVDDEPDLEALVLQKFRRQIRDGVVQFVFAHDGIEALQSIEQHPHVDMVVSDINMPRMDGLSLLAKLQEAEDKKSTIIVSAYGDMSNIRTAMNRGAFDFLTKPIDFGDLEMTINKTIRHVEMMREARRRQAEAERAHASLSRYFSPQIASRLASRGESNGMEVHRREVATIFTDITSFTSLVETAAPEVLGALLNEYVGGMTDAVFAHEGTVAKIIGDAIQILFNAPGDQPDYATRAIACAHDLDVWAEAFRERWKAKGVNFGVTRIGVHAGSALVGNFGGSRFFDYTAYGDTINTAARLEAANKFLGTRICVSATVAEGTENFRGRPVGGLMLPGGSEPLPAYDPLPAAAFEEPATAQYSEAFAKLEAGDTAAMPAFAALVGLHADDALAGFHLRRLLNGAKGVRMQLE